MTTTTPATITLPDGRTVDVARVDWVGARRAVVHYTTPDGYRDTITLTPREVITGRADPAPAPVRAVTDVGPHDSRRCTVDGCGTAERDHRPGAFRYDGHRYAPPPWRRGTIAAADPFGRRFTIAWSRGGDARRAWVSHDIDPGHGATSYGDDVTGYRIIGGHVDTIRDLHRWAVDHAARFPWIVDPATPGGRQHAAWIAAVGRLVPPPAAAPVATTTADGRPVAVDRAETDPCEAGTPGCCVRHLPGDGGGCETW